MNKKDELRKSIIYLISELEDESALRLIFEILIRL